jgi:hypothetical protein
VVPPGPGFRPPEHPTSAGTPRVFEHSGEAGPDQTFFAVGDGLAADVSAWGVGSDASRRDGQEVPLKVQFATGAYLAATLDERAQDGPVVVRARNAKGFSAPIVLNVPQPWWCGPGTVPAGGRARLFGRGLARRPDFARAFVYVGRSGGPGAGAWVATTGRVGPYAVEFEVPGSFEPGAYEVWAHAGAGGAWGWGGPVPLVVTASKPAAPAPPVALPANTTGPALQQALDTLSSRGGGALTLPSGVFEVRGTLRVPRGVRLEGQGASATILQTVPDPTARFARLAGPGWNSAPGRIHTPGDTMTYTIDVPAAGTWTVWARYGTDMKPWGNPGMSGSCSLSIDGGAAVPMNNLDNTGSWAAATWSKAATLDLAAGRHALRWTNEKGGGISLDAFVFSLDPAFQPGMTPPPVSGPRLVVIQAEDVERFETKEGELPGGDRAAVWLAGDGASLARLSVLGSAETNLGVAARSPEPLAWLSDVVIEDVRVADLDGKKAENAAVHVKNVAKTRVIGCELTGRVPLFLSGARDSEFLRNRLVSVTRFGGNAEAAILGRTEPIERCVIEDNVVASPPGAMAGGPTARRLLWFSTGHGSIIHNWIAGNGVEAPRGPGAATGAGPSRFGGVAGTDQNVGEMILFEGNHRTMYFGPLAGASATSVTLPATVPPTPDDRLGTVTRADLAHDAKGQETPFWPPDADDGTDEPPLSSYFVTVMAGPGHGQTRRATRREGTRVELDRPWAVDPVSGSSVVAIGTMFHRNLIVGNTANDGMTGVQLWISCVENVVAGNSIARQRKPALFLYGNATTLASSMPRTWNRGISPLFWNIAEGNRAEECSAGALVTSGEGNVPIEFPRALGNVVRFNSFARNRTDGVVMTARGPIASVKDTSAAVAGTIVEFNVVRDARVGYHVGPSADLAVLRRNHAYFWYPVSNAPATEKPVGFQVDTSNATVPIELNSVEGIHGNEDQQSTPVRRAGVEDGGKP